MAEESLMYKGEGLDNSNNEGSAQPRNKRVRLLKRENGDAYVLTREVPGFLNLYGVIKAENVGKFLEIKKKMGY